MVVYDAIFIQGTADNKYARIQSSRVLLVLIKSCTEMGKILSFWVIFDRDRIELSFADRELTSRLLLWHISMDWKNIFDLALNCQYFCIILAKQSILQLEKLLKKSLQTVLSWSYSLNNNLH